MSGGRSAWVKLNILNTYELYPTEVTQATVAVPLPVPPEGSDERHDWEYEFIHAHTGVGHSDGDSWYDVEIIASTAPELIGMTFEFGY